jgi:hypothetical protein
MASGSGCGKADEGPECSAVKEKDRLPVPTEFFAFVGPASKAGNSLYRCLKCPPGNSKPLSCSDVSRLNLKKHVEV